MRLTRILLGLAATSLLAACAASETPASTSPPEPDPAPTTATIAGGATGTITVRLEQLDGFLIEGFEAVLRFETPEGEIIAATLWSDFVESLGNPTLDDFYDSVLEQTVPAGEVVVLATLNVGIGPGPEVPDIEGDLRCRLVVDVPADGRVDVELSFDGSESCLSQVS